MLFTNDGGNTYFNFGQLRELFPNISFTTNTPYELGYVLHVLTPVVPELTPEQVKQELTQAVQVYLDDKARTYGYDGILSACSYAPIANAFQAEGVAFLTWRSAVWSYCYQVLADVTNNLRTVPTVAELKAELTTNVALVL